MRVSWKQCEGQVINNTFPLQAYLGGSGDSAVFLTLLSGPQPTKAAIKLIPSDSIADLQLSLWRRASQLSHPSLLRLLQSGRCQLADMDLLYVVMEFADEDLSQILPERPLTPSEARQMLEPILSALNYLHGQGLVHSHIKPSNVLAIGDQLKVSSDALFPIGESRKASARSDVYAAPESAGGLALSPAADVWSLGVTLVEALTQRAPKWQQANEEEPPVPDTIPQPFFDIAQHALRRDPKLRWTIAQIANCLNPLAAAAAAGPSISPVAIPISTVPALPAAKLQSPRPVAPAPRAEALKPQAVSTPRQTIFLPNYAVPLAAAALVIAGILFLPRILGRRAETSSSNTTPRASATTQTSAKERTTSEETTTVAKPAARAATSNARKTTEEMRTAEGKNPPEQLSKTEPVSTAPASLRTETAAPAATPKNPAGGPARGDILEQVLPDVSEKALATIHGKVRVIVLVHVDAAGNVSDAELDSPGPSKYFADLALKASRRWEFSSPEVDGRSVPSEWRVEFNFSQSGVKASPKQTAP